MRQTAFKNLPKTVWAVFWAFLIVSAGNYVSQFMSLYLTGSLGLRAGYSGIIVSLAGIVSMPGIILGGILSDIWGRKRAFTAFQLCAVVVAVIMAFIENGVISPVMVVLNSFFIAAIHPICNATIFQVTEEKDQSDGLSLFFIGMYAGYMLSGLGCALWFAKYHRVLFMIEAVFKAISIIIFNIWVEPDKENARTSSNDKKNTAMEEHGVVYTLCKSPMLLLYSISCILFSIVYTQSAYSLPIQLNYTYGHKGNSYYGSIMAFNAVIIVVGTRLISKEIKRHNILNLIIISVVLAGGGMGILWFSSGLLSCVVSTVFWSVAYIINMPLSGVFIESYSPKNMLGRFAAWIKIVTGAGYALGPVLFGHLIEVRGVRFVWLVCILLMAVNVMILVTIKLKELVLLKRG